MNEFLFWSVNTLITRSFKDLLIRTYALIVEGYDHAKHATLGNRRPEAPCFSSSVHDTPRLPPPTNPVQLCVCSYIIFGNLVRIAYLRL